MASTASLRERLEEFGLEYRPYRIDELAELRKVSTTFIRAAVRAGDLKVTKLSPRAQFFEALNILQWLEAGRSDQAKPRARRRRSQVAEAR